MMSHKIAAVATAGAMMLSMAGLVGAYDRHHSFDEGVAVSNTGTSVTTVAGAIANTGAVRGSGHVRTGNVNTLITTAESNVNTTMIPSCNCSRDGLSVKNTRTNVNTVAVGVANTGLVSVDGSRSHHHSQGALRTGDVYNVDTLAGSTVNYTGFSVSPN